MSSFAKIPLFCLFLASTVACTGSGLSGSGAKKRGGSKKESSGKGSEELGNDQTDGGQAEGPSDGEDGGNEEDPNDYAMPKNVTGSYLTCAFSSASQGSASFGCSVFNAGLPDTRAIKSIEKGTILGTEAQGLATATVIPDGANGLIVNLTYTGSGKPTSPVVFDVEIDLTFEDGTTSTVNSPYELFIPSQLYAGTPEFDGFRCDSTTLPDGRAFATCVGAHAASTDIPVKWTKLGPTDPLSDQKTFIAPFSQGQCDLAAKVGATFTEDPCDCEEGFFRGSAAITADQLPNVSDVCLVVESKVTIFGLPKTAVGIVH